MGAFVKAWISGRTAAGAVLAKPRVNRCDKSQLPYADVHRYQPHTMHAAAPAPCSHAAATLTPLVHSTTADPPPPPAPIQSPHRTGTATLGNQAQSAAQAAARGGVISDPIGTRARTTEVGRASTTTRASVGGQVTQSAVQVSD